MSIQKVVSQNWSRMANILKISELSAKAKAQISINAAVRPLNVARPRPERTETSRVPPTMSTPPII
jgi:hypothetical protein